MSKDNICPECNTVIGNSAFMDADGKRVCARCISGEDRDAAILRAFPNGIPENLE
jgi:formylmethanofuran dehydrogenase subunit E